MAGVKLSAKSVATPTTSDHVAGIDAGDSGVDLYLVSTLLGLYDSVTATMTNKTLTTPTISSTGWSNAVHAHAANNSGGTLNASAIAAGTLAHERGGIEADISAITTGGLLVGTSSGVMGILTVGADGLVLTAQADGTAAWESNPAAAVTALNNAAESRLVTIGNTTTELDGEANLTFDGSTLTVNADLAFTGPQTISTSSGALTVTPTTDTLFSNGTGVVIGHTAQVSGSTLAELQVLGTGVPDTTIQIGRWSANTSPGNIDFVKSRHATIGSNTIVNDNDLVGRFRFLPADGVDFATIAATYYAEVDDASPAAGDVGMAFVWEQMPGAAGALAETMRLDAAGHLRLATGASLFLKEKADAAADVAGYGQLWVDTATPNVLYFTDDAGTDFLIAHNATTTLSSLVTVGALNSGSIATGFGNIDNGTSNITTGGTLTIDVDGSAQGAAGSLTLGAGTDAAIYWDGTQLVIDSDADIDIEIATALDFTFAANNFNVLVGSEINIEGDGSGIGAANSITWGVGEDGAIYSDGTNLLIDAAAALDFRIGGATIGDWDTGGLNLVTGDTFQINNTAVLSGSTLGSGVTASSLTSVGTIATGVWNGTAVTVTYGGTGATTLTDGGILLGSGTGAITAMSVLADGEIVVGDGTADPVALAAFTNSTGVLKHESGGIELDISAITTGGLLRGTGSGTMGILTIGTDGQVLTAQADGTVAWENAGGGGVSPAAEFLQPHLAEGGSANLTYLVGEYAVAQFPDSGAVQRAVSTIRIPAGFSSISSALIICWSQTTNDLVWRVQTKWAADGEAYEANSDSIAETTRGMTSEQLDEIDVSAALTGIAAGDNVGFEFERVGTSGSDTISILYVVGLLLEYT